jgi:succinoglycan biosynthesis protein ExoO/succinoglycan biosynthesis protein ExoU
MSSPQVSVIVPAYNAAAYVGEAIRSVLAQTAPDFEVIVVDDASTDETAAIVSGFADIDGRVRLLRMARNGGPSASRNAGMAEARGEWIALLDADDRFHHTRLATLLALGGREGADIVSDNLLLCSDDDPTGQVMIPPDILAAPRLLSFAEFIGGCHYDEHTPSRVRYVFMHPMFRRAFMTAHGLRYNELNRNGEDFLLYLDCFLAGARWFITPEPFYLYSVRSGSMTENASDGDQYRIVDRLRGLLTHPAVTEDPGLQQAISRHWRLVGGDYYYYGLKRSVLAGNAPAALRMAFADPAATRLILRRIGRKLLPRPG